jgi:predicted RNA-binding Zn-ribbon protein involved in translation (DUF1610 family)
MLNRKLNMACPYCGQHQVELITEIDPMSFNYHELTKMVCMFCGKVIEPSEVVTYSNSTDSSYTTAGSAYKYCDRCNTKMEKFGGTDWWMCPNCHYGYMDYIGDLPKESPNEEVEMSKKMFEGKLHIPCDNAWGVDVGKINNKDLLSNTLQFDRCEKIIFRDKTLDFIFEIPEERYKDIDTIIVNGHKFVRENNEHK